MDARKLIAGLALFLAVTGAEAASTTINGVTYDTAKPAGAEPAAATSAEASVRFKKIFLFPSIDDMSGVLAPKLDEKLVQLLSRNTRFELVRDPQVLRALAPDDAAYNKAAQNQAVHREAAKVTGSDTTVILRTRNVGNQTEMTLEFRDANGDLLLSESGAIPGFASMDVRWGLVDKLFKAALAKIPFDATVTGRTANSLTLDLGTGALRPGEDVELVKIVSVQRHPLLRTIVGTDYVRVGRARVTNVDRSLSFAEVVEEYPGELIAPGAKVLRTKSVQRLPEASEPGDIRRQRYEEPRGKEEKDPFEERLSGEFDRAKPRYGQVGVNLQYGSLTHSQAAGIASEYSGSGVGGNLEGELWVTKNWIASAYYGFHNASLSGDGITVGDTSWSRMEGFAGYRFFPQDMGGAYLTGSLGYQVQEFALPTPTGLTVGGKRYVGIALKIEGELPFMRDQKITGGFGFQPFSSFTETGGALGVPDGANVIAFNLAWNYRFADGFWARFGFQFDTASGSYKNNATVTDKRFAIGPGIFYSF